jgi:KDO2-lipid IV(A) lauroyltransferase
VAQGNLRLALPELAAQHPAIIRGMWDNLGRTMAEYAQLGPLGDRIEIIGAKQVQVALASGKTAIFFSGHLANWEIPARAVKACGLELALVYRQPNNPFVDRLLRHARLPVTRTLAAKGGEGAKALIGLIRQHRSIGMLVDQKMNDGLSIPFFGHPAMTAPAMVKLAQKFDLPLYPVEIERLRGARFRVIIHPALVVPADLTVALTEINALLESWIRKHPEQWLWVHRRWPSGDSPRADL